MNAAKQELIEGLGLAVLALLLSGALLYGAFVAFGKTDYFRLAVFGVLGVIGLYWAVRFTRAQLAAYRAWKH